MRKLALLILFTLPALVYAESEEAKKLTDEAMDILRANADHLATDEEYATAIFKLERAQAFLDTANDNDSLQAQEVSAALFWAKRFSSLPVIALLEKKRTAEGFKPTRKVTPKGSAGVGDDDKDALPEIRQQKLAKEAYELAERYAGARHGENYAIALRYFQVANSFPGTEYALKALQKAREAQELAATAPTSDVLRKPLEKTVDPKQAAAVSALAQKREKEKTQAEARTPAMELVRDGDTKVRNNQYDDAIAKYKDSLKAEVSIPGLRKLAMAYFKKAEHQSEEVTPRLIEFQQEYSEAYKAAWIKGSDGLRFNDRAPVWTAAQQKLNLLRKENSLVVTNYAAAEQQFREILKLDKEDFDAAAYVCVSMARRPDSKFRARTALKDFLKDYKPINGEQMITYEYCKTELDRMGR